MEITLHLHTQSAEIISVWNHPCETEWAGSRSGVWECCLCSVRGFRFKSDGWTLCAFTSAVSRDETIGHSNRNLLSRGKSALAVNTEALQTRRRCGASPIHRNCIPQMFGCPLNKYITAMRRLTAALPTMAPSPRGVGEPLHLRPWLIKELPPSWKQPPSNHPSPPATAHLSTLISGDI